jgi:hypothetical protein
VRRRRTRHDIRREIHAQQRAWQRYRLGVSRRDLEEIADLIAHGHAVLVKREWPRAVYDVIFRGLVLRTVFDWRHANVVTFLPLWAR